MTKFEKHRRSMGLTQLQLAARANLSGTTISRVEQGLLAPREATRKRLARTMKVSRAVLDAMLGC